MFWSGVFAHPTAEELEKILVDNEARGFPRHAGSVDCMHWPWHN
jgi:hypothetical protein